MTQDYIWRSLARREGAWRDVWQDSNATEILPGLTQQDFRCSIIPLLNPKYPKYFAKNEVSEIFSHLTLSTLAKFSLAKLTKNLIQGNLGRQICFCLFRERNQSYPALWCRGGGDGLVVSILAFYSNDPSSNPAGYLIFSTKRR